MLNRFVLFVLAFVLLSPCPACTPYEHPKCVEYICGSYDMKGEWVGDLHEVTWREVDGERTDVLERDIEGVLRVAGTGCANTVAGQIGALAQDDRLIIDDDYTLTFDLEGNYQQQWSWRGECTIEQCFLDAELTQISGGSAQPVQRGEFTFTNLERFGS